MNVEDLYYFLKVAREGSISKAANSLHMTQSALSKCILRLERELGVSLLERGWGGVKVTKEGTYLLLHASSFIQQLYDVQRTMKSYSANHTAEPHVAHRDEALVVGIDPWLVPVLGSTVVQCLCNHIENNNFRLITRSSQTLFQLLEEGAIDIGFGYQPQLTHHSVKFLQLGLDPMVYVYPASEMAFEPKNTDLPFLLFDNPIYNFFRDFTKQLDHLINLSNYKVIDNVELMFELIANGRAYTITNRTSIHRYLTSDKLVIRELSESIGMPIVMLVSDHLNKSSELERLCVTLGDQLVTALN